MCAVRRSLATGIKRFAQRSGYRRALVSGASGCNVLRLPADVAQLVEQRFRKPQVTGSNPVVGSSLPFHRGFALHSSKTTAWQEVDCDCFVFAHQKLSVEIRFQKNVA